MHYLEIPRARETDVGQVRIVARNSEGEAEVSTSLNVLPHDDWRSQLRQAPKGKKMWTLSFAILWANLADDRLMIFFLFLPENGI